MAQRQLADGTTVIADVQTLGQMIVMDSKKRKIRLGLLWRKRPVIFVFLRHFACITCRAHAQEVWLNREKWEATGAHLVFVGNGAPEFIGIFKAELDLNKALILTDPSLASFRAAGFKYGFMALAQLETILNAVKLASKGHTQTSYAAQGSVWQLGGVLAVNTRGEVVYQYISESYGDLPPESDVEVIMKAEQMSRNVESKAS